MKSDNNTKNLEQNQSEIETFVTGGTLGDAYIVFCKLFDYHRRTAKQIRLIRYSSTTELDEAITQLFKAAPYVQLEPCRRTNSIKETDDSIKKAAEDVSFINQMYNGRDDGIGLTDSEYMKMEPYPTFDVPVPELNSDKFNIGVQLHSGKVNGNFKGFALRWLAAVRSWLPQEEFDVYLFGTGAGYNMKRVARFCKRYSIRNYVGKTDFFEWLGYIKAMGFFITPEGFSAFFAMSQRVRSLVFYTDYRILGRVHPNWRRENIIMSVGQETLVGRIINRICRDTIGRNRLLRPLHPAQIRSLMDGEIVYR